MLEAIYYLNKVDESFGPPDTPKFSFQDTKQLEANSDESKEDMTASILEDNLTLQSAENTLKSSNVSLWMVNSIEQQLSFADNNQEESICKEQEDKLKIKPCKSRFLINLQAKIEENAQANDQDKENIPLEHAEIPPTQHPSQNRIQQRFGNNVETDEPREPVMYAAEETTIQQQTLEQKIQIPAIKMTIEALGNIQTDSRFWKIQKLKFEQDKQRHRWNQSQFWLGETIRYYKGNQIIVSRRMPIQEVFLNLKCPQQILTAITTYVGSNILTGQITLRPFSKVKAKYSGSILRLSISGSSSVSLSFENNRIKIKEEKGMRRLCLNNAQIKSIKNLVHQPICICVKISSNI